VGSKHSSILFLGAGKRVSLLRYFKKAIKEADIKCNLFCYEIDKEQPASIEASIIQGLKWTDTNLVGNLSAIIQEHNVIALIPCVDPAILISEKLNSQIQNRNPNTEIIEICNDKIKFDNFCVRNSIKVIPRAEENLFPTFVKPVTGSASNGAQIISSKQELKNYMMQYPNLIFQKIMHGAEYTIDCFITKNRDFFISPRKRLEVVAGEVTVTKTFIDDELYNLSKQFLTEINYHGPVTLQYIEDREGNKYLMECNLRYGGGVICSIFSGYNFPSLHLSEIFGTFQPKKFRFSPVLMKRYNKEIFFADSY
jgi:carbamoyl-phosphate synthase large subunit